MITTSILYLLIATFLAGWWFGADWAQRVKRPMAEQAGIIGCCLAWPFTFFVIFKMWKEGKL